MVLVQAVRWNQGVPVILALYKEAAAIFAIFQKVYIQMYFLHFVLGVQRASHEGVLAVHEGTRLGLVSNVAETCSS